MADIKWIKVAVDMFEDNKIEFIRSLPEGDAIIVTWIQMLSIAGQSNMGGYLMVAEGIPYTEQLLSNKLRRQPVLLQFALETLTRLKMIDADDGPFHITKWEKHQNVEGMEKVRLLTNERVKKHRTKEKEKLETLPSNATVTLQVTQCNATELELEVDLELDKKKKIKELKEYPADTVELTTHLIDLMLLNNPNVKIPTNLDKWNDEMEKLERIDKYDYMQIRSVIDWCQQDSFWKGNILSTAKLREKIATLLMQMQRPKAGASGNSKVSSFTKIQQMYAKAEEDERIASNRGY